MTEENLVELIVERAADKLARAMRGIVPDRVYPPDEAAELIGYRGVRGSKSIREIPRSLLPLIPVTPGGRIVGYIGRDLLRYIEQRRQAATKELERVG